MTTAWLTTPTLNVGTSSNGDLNFNHRNSHKDSEMNAENKCTCPNLAQLK